MARFGFNTADYEAESEGTFELLPDGEYTLMCVKAEEKETKAKNGSYLSAEFDVVGGKYDGRKVWHNFTLNNPSDKAEKIGRGEIRAWAKAVGLPDASDSDQLLDRPFKAVVGIEKGTGGYQDSNNIKKFVKKGESGAAPAVTKSPPASTAKSKWEDEEEEDEAPVKEAEDDKLPWN